MNILQWLRSLLHPTARPTPPPAAASSDPRDILPAVNAFRVRHNLPALLWHDGLASAAQDEANWCANHRTLAHDRPFFPFSHRVRSYCPNVGTARENIADGQPDADAVADAWMGDDGHRQNMLAIDVTHLGGGIARDSGGTTYYAADFGGF